MLLAAAEVAGLDAEHDGDADDHDQKTDKGNNLLRGNDRDIRWYVVRWSSSDLEEHVDHALNDGRSPSDIGLLLRVGSGEIEGVDPLGNDEGVHVAEEAVEDEDLGDELEEEVNVVAEVNVVESFEDDSEGHLSYSKNDCDLLLEGVEIS